MYLSPSFLWFTQAPRRAVGRGETQMERSEREPLTNREDRMFPLQSPHAGLPPSVSESPSNGADRPLQSLACRVWVFECGADKKSDPDVLPVSASPCLTAAQFGPNRGELERKVQGAIEGKNVAIVLFRTPKADMAACSTSF
ncbi:unnamed protein product [Pleuronectes platessa]|uniref:Uncharacterized protein n=1 Tax=Pleuronectes platessa TaxID=8262 RepID=A0A9N7UN33_PLEPL|nr:unnamed protein product [Pleuronectes platessa]